MLVKKKEMLIASEIESRNMVAVAAKDAVDYAISAKENQDLLGQEGEKIMGELYKNLLRYEEHVGEMRPDMAYSPSN